MVLQFHRTEQAVTKTRVVMTNEFGQLLHACRQHICAILNPVTLGVILGLVFGKLAGIVGATWLGWKLGLGRLPTAASFHHIIGVAMLGGIGFTMSIFISELAFYDQNDLLIQAKAGVLLASVIAGVAGYLILRRAPVSEEVSTVSDKTDEEQSEKGAEPDQAKS